MIAAMFSVEDPSSVDARALHTLLRTKTFSRKSPKIVWIFFLPEEILKKATHSIARNVERNYNIVLLKRMVVKGV